MASASSRRHNRNRDFHPPRTWAWVLTFWILLLSICFICARPPSIVWYYRQNLYNYLWELCRSFVSTAILLWRLCLWDSIHHLWDFLLRSWELAMMQLHSVDLSLIISRLGRAWDVLKVVAGLLIGQWPILPVFAPDLIGKVFWGSFKPKKQTTRAWLIEKMVISVIGVLLVTCGKFFPEHMGVLLMESWFVVSTWWSMVGIFHRAHIWKERSQPSVEGIREFGDAWFKSLSPEAAPNILELPQDALTQQQRDTLLSYFRHFIPEERSVGTGASREKTVDAPLLSRPAYKEVLLVKMQEWRPNRDLQELKDLIHYEDEDNYRNNLRLIDIVREHKRYEYYARQKKLHKNRAFHIYGTDELFALDCLKSWVKLRLHHNPSTPFPPDYTVITNESAAVSATETLYTQSSEYQESDEYESTASESSKGKGKK